MFLARFRVKRQAQETELVIIIDYGQNNEHSSIISSEAMDIERFFSGKADFFSKKTGILIFYTKTGLKIPQFSCKHSRSSREKA